VDRQRNASNIFHTGRLTFSPGCGWWFGLAWLQPEQKVGHSGQTLAQRVEQTLNLLADTGLGGERAAGYGHFDCQQVGASQWDDPAPGQLFVTLSRYHPRPAELPTALQDNAVAYKLVSVGGWLNSPGADGQAKAQRRRRLWLVAEGSVVRTVGNGPWGDVTDVRPVYPGAGVEFPHPIWRYGLACPVAWKGGSR
jgi:CRISPR type III-A-associated RAMP protein Csm4